VTVPLVLDTDIGTDIDDAVALAAAVASPTFRLVGITTVYVDAPLRARLARRLLELAGVAEVPVWAGESVPLRPRPDLASAGVWEWHEGRGVLYDDISVEEREYRAGRRGRARPYSRAPGDDAPARLAQLARDHPGLVVVSVAPLTNVAAALDRHPDFESAVGLVTVMGGCFRPGAATPQLEHNFGADPGATERVLRSSLPLTVVGFDATESCYLVRDDAAVACDGQSPYAAAMSRLIDVYFDVKGRWRTAMHDPIAVGISEDPTLGEIEETEVFADPTTGETSLQPFPGAVGRRLSLLRRVPPERGAAFVRDRLRAACEAGGEAVRR
jgi:purine nucleosidase